MSVEEVRRGVSEQRNKGLAAICYRLKLIEAYGTGFDKMDFAYSGSGVTCQISVTPNSFCLTLPNRNKNNNQGSRDTTPAIPLQLNDLNPTDRERAEKLVGLCQKNGFVTREQAQKELMISQTTAVVLLNRMIDKRLLIRSREGKQVIYKLLRSK